MFTSKTLSFLRSLKRNNRREWFHERRDQYETHCREPLTEVVRQLGVDLQRIVPEMLVDPKVNLLRPFRDTRFSEDKTPLKTHIAATFPHRSLGRMNGAGLYFEVAPGWVWIGGGIYNPDTSQSQLLREHVADNYRQLDAIVRSPRFRKLGGLKGDTMTRVPRGFPKDHPAAEYLRHRQFMGWREEPAVFATSTDFYKQLLWTFETLVPLLRFINEPLLTARRTDRLPSL